MRHRSVFGSRRVLVAAGVSFGLAAGAWIPGAASAALGPASVTPSAALSRGVNADVNGDGVLSEREAMAAARRSGVGVEVSALASPTQRVVADPVSGGFRAQISVGPSRTRQADGSWKDVDLTLVRGSDGLVRPVNSAAQLTFSGGEASSPGAPAAQVEVGGKRLGFGWPTALPVPVLSGPVATYADVLPGVDLVAQAGAEGVATYLVVKDRAAASNPALSELRMPLHVEGVEVTATAKGIRGVDSSGALVFGGDPFRMWDAKGANSRDRGSKLLEGQGAKTATMPASVRSSGMGGAARRELVITPDLGMLQDPGTQFPVTIDPSSNVAPKDSYWVMVWSDGQDWHNSTTVQPRVGYDGWSSATKKSRVYYRFDTSALGGKVIDSAEFVHYLTHSPDNVCTNSTFGPGVKVGVTNAINVDTVWPGPAFKNYSPTINDDAHGYDDYCTGYTRVEWEVDYLVKTYAADADADWVTFGMISSDETNRDGWRKYSTSTSVPFLNVLYRSRPDIAEQPTVDGAGVAGTELRTNDTTPTLRSVVGDADGGSINARFDFYNSTPSWGIRGSATSPAGVPSGDEAQFTYTSAWTPSTVLKTNTQYVVYATAIDDTGLTSPDQSPYIRLVIDTIPPGPQTMTGPGTVTVGATYPVTVTHSSETDIKSYCWVAVQEGVTPEWTSQQCVPKAASGTSTTFNVGPFNLGMRNYQVHLYARDAASNNGTAAATVHTFAVE